MNKKLMTLVLALVSASMIGARLVLAQSEPKKLLIVEISTGNSLSASAEYVEIYNPNNSAVDLDGYKLEYRSAAGSDWSTKSNLTGKLGPRGRYLLATSQLSISSSATMGSGLPASGGHLRISNADKVLDLLGWGNASLPESLAAAPHIVGESLKRYVDEDGVFIDNDNNFLDFFQSSKPSPLFDAHAETAPAAPVIKTPDPANPSTSVPGINSSSGGSELQKKSSYPAIELSELFIDPKSPQTDKEDEYIEVYNPNDQAVDMSKYKIQTGSTTWRYTFEIDGKIIKAKSFMAFYPEESGLTLSNGGAKAQIVDPNGKVLDGVVYEKAKAGQSLIKLDGKWMWTDMPTPDQKNVASAESGSTESDDNSSSTTDESGNFPTVASATSSKDSKSEDSKTSFEDEGKKSTLDTSVLVIVGGLAILYGLYEYRQDIRGAFAKLARYYANWRETRRAAKGR
jgi:predicted extracellular nuclease